MASYQMYFLSEDAIASSEKLLFEHDLAAVEFARSNPRNQAVQIWQADRFIGEVRPKFSASKEGVITERTFG